jgi:hypothetical protein
VSQLCKAVEQIHEACCVESLRIRSKVEKTTPSRRGIVFLFITVSSVLVPRNLLYIFHQSFYESLESIGLARMRRSIQRQFRGKRRISFRGHPRRSSRLFYSHGQSSHNCSYVPPIPRSRNSMGFAPTARGVSRPVDTILPSLLRMGLEKKEDGPSISLFRAHRRTPFDVFPYGGYVRSPRSLSKRSSTN